MSAREALEFAKLVHRVDPETLSQIDVVNADRRPLLSYAALVLEHLIREIDPKEVVMSVMGVREGLLYSLLAARERGRDPLIAAADELNILRSRSPRHGEELVRVDRRLHGVIRARRGAPKSYGCAAPPVCSPILAGGRIPIIAASSR